MNDDEQIICDQVFCKIMVIIAQLVERRSVEAEVVGAEPTGHPQIFNERSDYKNLVYCAKQQC